MRKKFHLQNSITKSRIILFLFCLATLFMGIGYATINSVTFNIEGTAIAKAQEGVFITDVKYISDNNANQDNSKINKYYQTTLNSTIALSNTDAASSITYEVTIYNSTDKAYYFDKVDYLLGDTTYSNENIVFELNGLKQNDVLNGKNSSTFTITFHYKDNILPDNNILISYLNFKFDSDTVTPTWSIVSVSQETVKTTDTFKIEIEGTDNRQGVTSTLDVSKIDYLVSESSSSPIDKSLKLKSSSEEKVTYELTLTMLGGSGNLKIYMNSGTLIDKSGNESTALTLDTGITMVKDGEQKILIWKDYYSRFYNSISNYYSNITIDETISVDDIIANNYDLVIYYYPFWQVPATVNRLFDAGINLVTQGNDWNKDLYINDSNEAVQAGGAGTNITNKIDKVASNNLTRFLPNSFTEGDGQLFYGRFNPDAKVLYQSTYNGENYDKIGYLKRNNTTWFHLQVANNLDSGYVPIVEFVRGKLIVDETP